VSGPWGHLRGAGAGPVIAAERVVRWVAVAGVAIGGAWGVRDVWHVYTYGSRWFPVDWEDPLLLYSMPAFVMPVLILLACAAILYSRTSWTRYLLISAAVIWFGISSLGFAWSVYKVPTHWTPVQIFADDLYYWMTDVLYPVAVLLILTRPEVKAVFGGRGGGGFDPVMGAKTQK
jgi:hypothetical protein